MAGRGSRFHAALDRKRMSKARRAALARAGWRCQKCGGIQSRLEVDHVVPLHRGGDPYSLDNLQVLCAYPCHRDKTASENRKPDPARDAWRVLVAEIANT